MVEGGREVEGSRDCLYSGAVLNSVGQKVLSSYCAAVVLAWPGRLHVILDDKESVEEKCGGSYCAVMVVVLVLSICPANW